MKEPTEKLKWITLNYVYDPNFYFVNFQEERFDALISHDKSYPSRNELLLTIYWLEWKGFVIRKQPFIQSKKTYFITDKGKLLYWELERMGFQKDF
ncbi:DUF3116 family protein [Listeria aquatica]|uniref:Uncharacterized protein n=2 Tax=Listeria aquatica TaxID=1494960 RepID=W7B9L2_9LIST|nr:DUF3116 family protein [Listeria aquatica]EUJ21385.1 hypothetical protein MAQA_01492 [Listeria aquatica FSL S10-1188]MBC1522054.1 DUF3116 family protein [Listeria aquatica]